MAKKTYKKSKSNKQRVTYSDFQKEMTQKIVEHIENNGELPWNAGFERAFFGLPKRHTGETYSGMNQLILLMTAMEKGYQDECWMTFNQAKKLGGNVRQNEKSTAIFYFQKVDKTEKVDVGGEEHEEDASYMLFRTYPVFCASQIDNLPAQYYSPKREMNAIIERDVYLDELVENTGVKLTLGDTENPAYYPALDEIKMPSLNAYEDKSVYYSILFHELAHATGHQDRLNRFKRGNKTGTTDGTIISADELSQLSKEEAYAREELVAELSALFTQSEVQIDLRSNKTIENSAAYLQNWVSALKSDSRFIFDAARDASAATNWILDEGKWDLIAEKRLKDDASFVLQSTDEMTVNDDLSFTVKLDDDLKEYRQPRVA